MATKYETVDPADLPDEEHDAETGEVIRGEVLAEPIRNGNYAVGGGIVPGAAETAGQFLDLLDDGKFSAELAGALGKVGREMRELSEITGEKKKGKLVITLDLEAEGSAFRINHDFKITPPKAKRLPSTLFIDNRDRFTRFLSAEPPMFGVRR